MKWDISLFFKREDGGGGWEDHFSKFLLSKKMTSNLHREDLTKKIQQIGRNYFLG